MKYFASVLAAAAALVLAGTAIAHDVTVDRSAMDQRFDEMGRMMDRIPQMRGPDRREALHDHMHLMMRQMDAMHGMRGGHGGPMFGGAPGGQMSDSDLAGRMNSMQQRMDAMQRMMEQMLRQQEMLLEDEAG